MGCGGSSTEKEQQQNYKEFFAVHGSRMVLNDQKDTITVKKEASDMQGRATAYGNVEIFDNGKNSNMIYLWEFKLEGKGFRDPMDSVGIGIDGSGRKWLNDCFYISFYNPAGNTTKGPCYAWGNSGRRVNGSSSNELDKNDGYKYNDIIKMKVSLYNGTLTYIRNDTQIFQFQNIDFKNNKFHMAVRMQDNGATCALWEFEAKRV
eukprot:471586_1